MSDFSLKNVVNKLVKNKQAIGLVKIMRPLDVVSVIAKDYDLCPHDASKTAFGLIKHAYKQDEGLPPGSIETNKEYPVSSAFKQQSSKNHKKKEAVLARPANKTTMRPGPDAIQRHHFPPDPRDEVEDWPYDQMTVAGMKPGVKNRKKSLIMGKPKSKDSDYRFLLKKDPFDTNLSLRQPGVGGSGLQQKVFHKSGGDMPGAGNANFVARGTKGWNSPPGKTFDVPGQTDIEDDDVEEKKIKDDEEETPNFMKNPPVGTGIPTWFGGRVPGRRVGFQKK